MEGGFVLTRVGVLMEILAGSLLAFFLMLRFIIYCVVVVILPPAQTSCLCVFFLRAKTPQVAASVASTR